MHSPECRVGRLCQRWPLAQRNSIPEFRRDLFSVRSETVGRNRSNEISVISQARHHSTIAEHRPPRRVPRFETHQNRDRCRSAPSLKSTTCNATKPRSSIPSPSNNRSIAPHSTTRARKNPNNPSGLIEQKIRTRLREFLIHWCYPAILIQGANSFFESVENLASSEPMNLSQSFLASIGIHVSNEPSPAK